MKFYFYTNKNLVFDFLSRNIIAPDAIVKDLKRNRTIGTASEQYLFITHLKLDRKSREKGIAETEYVYPMTLELTQQQSEDGLAVLVSKGTDNLEYTLAKLSDYDTGKHIGAYLIGEIPLSRVEKIYFDTQEDLEMFSRPSPDYWYPVNKYALLPDGFADELSLEPNDDKLLETSGFSADSILSEVQNREKKRAALLNLISKTKHWQQGKYVFNLDKSMLKIFGLKEEEILSFMPHYKEEMDSSVMECISLVGEEPDSVNDINQKIYNHIRDVLMAVPYNTQKQPEMLLEALNAIEKRIALECETANEKKAVNKSITEIQKLVSDSSNKSPEEIITGIPAPIDVLKALLFVAKNPNRYDVFLESLEAYHADQITKRRAAVLWGVLNGLYGMPGESFEKDNQQLWRFIEAYIYNQEKEIVPTLSITSPKVVVTNGTLLGLDLKEERIVTAEEVRRLILSMPKERLNKAFYNKLFSAAEVEFKGKKKAENKGYACSIASVSVPEIKKGDVLSANMRKILEQLVKDSKSPVPNKEKLYADYIEDKKKFEFVFEQDPDYWKKAFMAAQEKNA